MATVQIQSDPDALLERLSCDADVYISRVAARDADYLPDRLRPAIVEMCVRLRGVVSSLFDVHAAYEDAFVLEMMLHAAPFPCEASAQQQLRFLHGHLDYAQATFSAACMRLESRFNEAIEVASFDEERVDLERIVADAGIDWMQSNLAPDTETSRRDPVFGVANPVAIEQMLSEPMQIASRWRADLPAFEKVHDQLRRELLLRVQARCSSMKIVSDSLLQACGPALLVQIERHNTMMRNFEIKGAD